MIVIVPYRPDHGHRDNLWTYLHTHYWMPQQLDEVVLGVHLQGPFNRSQAINTAADRDWDYAVLADADTWVPTAQLRKALLTARITGRLVAAFDAVVEISQQSTNDLLADKIGLADSFTTDRIRRKDLETQSSMLVIPRPLWDDIGGMDTRFSGWGGEDNALWKAADLCGGPPIRIPGNAYHLWHEPSPDKHRGPEYAANRRLWLRYQQATTKPQLRAIQR